MKSKRILTYAGLAFGISWSFWLPNVIAANFEVSWEPLSWLHLAGGLGPLLGALITIAIFEGRAGLTGYVKTKLVSVPDWKSTLLGLGMPVAFFGIAAVTMRFLTGDWVILADLGLNAKIPFENPLIIWGIWCVFYGLGEEGGWRGFLYPEFLKQYPARISTLYVAAIWAPWHLPVFFYDKDLGSMGWFGTIGWVVGLVFGSFLLGWLVKQARFNLWPVILWHGTFNFFTVSDRISPIFPGLMSGMVILVVLWLARRYDEHFKLL